jgi:myo-inositol-1(or 4)-monophosphatase
MNDILEIMEQIELEAGAMMKENYTNGPTGITLKARNDYVTDTDRKIEAFVKGELLKNFPDIPLLAEEGSGTASGQEGRFFCLDPLDGTNNFVHQIPVFCVSIALVENLSPTHGVIFDPVHDELFCAESGKGATLNGKTIHTSGKDDASDAFIATGFPFREHGRIKEYLEGFENILVASGGIRRCGAAAIDLCWTACGRFDAFWEFGLKPWDIAAGKLMVEEAGGVTSDTNGGKLDLFKGDILAAATEKLRSDLKNLIHKD